MQPKQEDLRSILNSLADYLSNHTDFKYKITTEDEQFIKVWIFYRDVFIRSDILPDVNSAICYLAKDIALVSQVIR